MDPPTEWSPRTTAMAELHLAPRAVIGLASSAGPAMGLQDLIGPDSETSMARLLDGAIERCGLQATGATRQLDGFTRAMIRSLCSSRIR